MLGGAEVDYDLMLICFLFMIYFGVIKIWIHEKSYRLLHFPMLEITHFSMGGMYLPIISSLIPFMGSQRAPMCFIIVPVIFLSILVNIQFESFIKDLDHYT